MPPLERLRLDHEAVVLDFELRNRSYFARWVSDRGDEFFLEFAQRFADLVADDGVASYVLVEHSEVLGRFNLYVKGAGVANVGYRMAEQHAGRGLATAALRELVSLAEPLDLTLLRAAVANENVPSARVLEKAGFVAVADAGPQDLSGKRGSWYERVMPSRGRAGDRERP